MLEQWIRRAVIAVLIGVGCGWAERVGSGTWGIATFPVEQFVAYTSPFGPRWGRFHYGLDIAAPQGSYIRNWWVGRVERVISDGECGTGLVIASGHWRHIYCHLQGRVRHEGNVRYIQDEGSGLLVHEGQWLGTGVRIGRIGMTGRTTGPHLHWGLQYQGRWIDPSEILIAMKRSQSEFRPYSYIQQGEEGMVANDELF